jgi:hypothetical protein
VNRAQEWAEMNPGGQERCFCGAKGDFTARALIVANLRKGNCDQCISGAVESQAIDCSAAVIAHSHRGESEEANRSYLRAVSLMNKDFDFVVTRKSGIEQLRVEAEELLGISKESNTGVHSTEPEN